MVRAIQMRLAKEALDKYNSSVECYYSLQGWLYPSVLYADLIKLREECIQAGADPLPLPQPPDKHGYAPRRLHAKPSV